MEQELTGAESGSGGLEIVTQALGAIKRRRWWALLIMAFTTFLALAALSVLPKKYTSTATLVVVQQQVPERYVTPTSTTDIAVALQAAVQEVLSRTRLLAIIAEFDLYSQQRRAVPPEVLEGRMRKQIKIEPILSSSGGERIDGFKISFTTDNPRKAQAVTSRLTQLFIDQNLETREHQATVTTSFLKEELDAAKAKLSQKEGQIRDFKMQNLGELPQQQNGNLSVLSSLQSQLQNLMAGESHAQEQQVYLESLLNGYRKLAKENGSVAVPGSGVQSADPIAAAQANLASLRAKKVTLSSLYTPEYPGVIALNAQIAQAEAELKTLRAERAASEAATAHSGGASAAANAAGASSELDPTIAPIKSQLEANRLERENLAKEEAKLKEQIAEYQQRLNLTPVREQQLADLTRDYDLMKADYADLLNKETQSQLARSLEKRQEGQQFRLVDSASLPVVPSFPKPIPIGAGGLVGGLGLGFVLAYLWDKRHGYFYREEELSRYLPESSVIAIPVLRTQSEERARKWKLAFEWAAGSALIAVLLAAECYELLLKKI